MNQPFNKTFGAVLPAGDYFIGDICYFLPDTIMDTLDSVDYGCFVNGDGSGYVVTKPDAGNGYYTGSNKFTYDVETNNLGIIPVALGNRNKFTGSGTFHKFTAPVTVSSNGQLLSIVSGDYNLHIDTSDNESIQSDDTGYDSWS